MFRGGCWYQSAFSCRVACRDYNHPTNHVDNLTGFRVARNSVQVGSGFAITSDVTVNTRSPVATLFVLTLSSGTLSPAFASSTTTYTASVVNTVTSIKVTPTVTDSTATVKVNGTTVASGTASGSVALAVGTNTITTMVTAEDGTTTKTYTVTLNRALSAIATLSGLALSSGTLSPAFAAVSTSYTVSVTNATTSITVTPTVTYTTATVKVNGTTVASGTASGSITLAVGTNTITTLVTAQDGTSTKIYTVIVTRDKSADATLSALVVKTATLGPKFKATTTTYKASVPLATTSVKIMATANYNKARLKVNGKIVKSGALSTAIPLATGRNTIKVVVTAEGGTTRTYTITISRKSSVGMAPMSVLADSHVAAETRVSKVTVNGQRFLQLTVVKPGPASRFLIEVSPNLVDWFSGDQHTTTVTDDGRILTVRDHTPLRAGENRFIRVKRN